MTSDEYSHISELQFAENVVRGAPTPEGEPGPIANDNAAGDEQVPTPSPHWSALIERRRRELGLATDNAAGDGQVPAPSAPWPALTERRQSELCLGMTLSNSRRSMQSKILRPNGLAAEWAAATGAVRQHHLDALQKQYGVSPRAILDRLGIARIRPAGTSYEPDGDGIEVVLIACFEYPPRLLDGRWRAPNSVIDLVAFRPADPGRSWSRRGLVAVLGEEALSDFSTEPVKVWRNPLHWLKAGALGVSPVSTDTGAVRDVLLRLPGIVAENVGHGREITQILMRHWNRLPPVFVAEQTQEVA